MRVRLHPDLVMVWRGPTTIQIGLDAHGLILDDLTPGEERLLQALVNGELTERGLYRLARRNAVDPALVTELLEELRNRGALLQATPPPPQPPPVEQLRLDPRRTEPDSGAKPRSRRSPRLDPRRQTTFLTAAARAATLRYPGASGWQIVHRRQERTALMVGAGPSGLRVATGLVRAGVGTVLLFDEGRVTTADVEAGPWFESDDVGRRRQHAAVAHIDGLLPSHTLDRPADLAVITADGALAPSSCDTFVRADVAHLPLILRERDAVVGPLVRPGHTSCLRCVELYRTDRDPQWPAVAAQVASHRFPPRDPSLLDLAAAVTVAQALQGLDGITTPLSEGTSLELSLDDPVPTLRPWPGHPRCGCSWPPASAASRSSLQRLALR